MSLSCENSKDELINYDSNGYPIITEKYKLDFLKEVLKDSIVLSGRYKNALIFNKEIVNSKRLINDKVKGTTQTKSDIQIIAMTLNEKDSSFVYNQYLDNDFNIENIQPNGHKIIDWKNIRKNIYIGDSLVEEQVFVTKDSLESIYQYLKKNRSVSISKPIFNKPLNKAYIEVDFSYLNGSGFLYEKTNNKWQFKDYAGGWTR